MKNTDWKDIVELCGIGAIVLSLILVAYEVRQNTLMMRAQTRDSLTEKQMTLNSWMATSEYTANVGLLGGRGELKPGTPEDLSYYQLMTGVMREWENSFYQYEQGLFDDSEFSAREHAWAGFLRIPGVMDYWARSRENFSPRFRAEIDRIVAKNEQIVIPE